MNVNTAAKYQPSCPKFSEWLRKNRGEASRMVEASKILSLPTLSKYKAGVNAISLEGAIEIERLTGGLFKAEHLSPKHADLIRFIRGN